MINGRGAVNGTGLVNGMGRTNGQLATSGPPVQSRGRARRAVHWRLMAVLVVVVIVIPSLIYLTYSDRTDLTIDGDFDDWNDTQIGLFLMASTSDGEQKMQQLHRATR